MPRLPLRSKNLTEKQQLIEAAKAGDAATVRRLLLLPRGSIDPNAAKDDAGQTPLHLAAENGSVETMQALLDGGARVDVPDNYRDTALHSAAFTGHLEAAQLLLDRGADINAQDNDLWAALHFAANFNHWKLARLLLDRGADVHALDISRQTALHNAALNGHLKVVRLLLSRGADLNAVDVKGETPLHLALCRSNERRISIMELLVEAGADPWLRNEDGCLPLDQINHKKKHERVAVELRFLPRRRFLRFLDGLGSLRREPCLVPSLFLPFAAASSAMERALWSGEHELIREICSWL